MNQHTAKPACYLEGGEPEERAPRFREGGRWCYMTVAEARKLTPGCFGCKRFREEARIWPQSHGNGPGNAETVLEVHRDGQEVNDAVLVFRDALSCHPTYGPVARMDIYGPMASMEVLTGLEAVWSGPEVKNAPGALKRLYDALAYCANERNANGYVVARAVLVEVNAMLADCKT